MKSPRLVSFVCAALIAVDLDMHDDRIRLLNLPNLAELHAIAESAGKISSAV